MYGARKENQLQWKRYLGGQPRKFKIEPGHGRINIMTVVEEATDNYLHDLIKSSFSTEAFSIKPTSKKGNDLEKAAMGHFRFHIKKVNGVWETELLWREDTMMLPDGERDALQRLHYTELKMRAPEFCAKYKCKIQKYLQKRYLRKLTIDEVAQRPPHTRYIPHFG